MSKVKFSVKNKSCFCLNILIKKGIIVKKPKFYDDRLEFFTDLKCLILCQKALKEYNIEYKVLSKRGAFVFLQRNIQRVGLVAGLIVGIIMLFLFSNCILKLNIQGLNRIEEKEVVEVIKSHISIPSVFKKFDLKALEKDIMQIEGVSSVAVEKGGATINIIVLEELPLPKIEKIKEEYKDIVSKHDSVVTRIVVTGGTPLVKKGQAVKKGQKLIGAYLMTDQEKPLVYTKAGGQVYGRVWLTKSKVIYPKKLVYEKTGKTYTEYKIPFLNWIHKDKKPPFSHYEKKIEKVTLGGGVNFEVEKITYYETKPKKVEVDIPREIEVVTMELYEKVEEQITEDMTRVRKWFEVKRLDKTVKIDIYYEVEMLII